MSGGGVAFGFWPCMTTLRDIEVPFSTRTSEPLPCRVGDSCQGASRRR